MVSIGTHNLLDGEGEATPFAEVIVFTEAVPILVRRALEKAYDIFVCQEQKDLVIAIKKGLWEHTSDAYKLAHGGVKKVTPHRGTFMIQGLLKGIKTRIFAEHRINASFPPFKRGEKLFRKAAWRRHTSMTLRWIRRSIKAGFQIFAGGDLNTIESVKGYRGVLHEVGSKLDRVGSTRVLKPRRIGDDEGSDHHKVWSETLAA